MKTTQTPKLYPLFFPTCHRCHTCQHPKLVSAVQILSDRLLNRQRYFCPTCATVKGCPPARELLSRLPEALEAKAKPAPGQKKAIAGGRK
jgi:hypothetical protein